MEASSQCLLLAVVTAHRAALAAARACLYPRLPMDVYLRWKERVPSTTRAVFGARSRVPVSQDGHVYPSDSSSGLDVGSSRDAGDGPEHALEGRSLSRTSATSRKPGAKDGPPFERRLQSGIERTMGSMCRTAAPPMSVTQPPYPQLSSTAAAAARGAAFEAVASGTSVHGMPVDGAVAGAPDGMANGSNSAPCPVTTAASQFMAPSDATSGAGATSREGASPVAAPVLGGGQGGVLRAMQLAGLDWRGLQLSSWRPNHALRSEGQLRRADGRNWKHLVRDHCRLPAYFGPVLHLRAIHQAWADAHQAAAAEAAASAVYAEIFVKILCRAAADVGSSRDTPVSGSSCARLVAALLRDAAPVLMHLAEHAVAYESQRMWPSRASYHRACRAWSLRALLRELRGDLRAKTQNRMRSNGANGSRRGAPSGKSEEKEDEDMRKQFGYRVGDARREDEVPLEAPAARISSGTRRAMRRDQRLWEQERVYVSEALRRGVLRERDVDWYTWRAREGVLGQGVAGAMGRGGATSSSKRHAGGPGSSRDSHGAASKQSSSSSSSSSPGMGDQVPALPMSTGHKRRAAAGVKEALRLAMRWERRAATALRNIAGLRRGLDGAGSTDSYSSHSSPASVARLQAAIVGAAPDVVPLGMGPVCKDRRHAMGQSSSTRRGHVSQSHPLRPLAWSTVGRRAFRYASGGFALDFGCWSPQIGAIPEPWEVAPGPRPMVSMAMFLRIWHPGVMQEPRRLGVTMLLRHPCPPRRLQPRTRPPVYSHAAQLAALARKPDRLDASGSAGGGTSETGLVPVPLRVPARRRQQKLQSAVYGYREDTQLQGGGEDGSVPLSRLGSSVVPRALLAVPNPTHVGGREVPPRTPFDLARRSLDGVLQADPPSDWDDSVVLRPSQQPARSVAAGPSTAERGPIDSALEHDAFGPRAVTGVMRVQDPSLAHWCRGPRGAAGGGSARVSGGLFVAGIGG